MKRCGFKEAQPRWRLLGRRALARALPQGESPSGRVMPPIVTERGRVARRAAWS